MLFRRLLFGLLITGRGALEAVPLNDARSCVLQHKIVHAVVTRTRDGLDTLKNAENSPIQIFLRMSSALATMNGTLQLGQRWSGIMSTAHV
jgi:hypothetical protein